MPVCTASLLAIHRVDPTTEDGRRVEIRHNHSHGLITTSINRVLLSAKPKSCYFWRI